MTLTTSLPALFVSHGAPTFALQPGVAGASLRELGRSLPRPEAVLVVSPHWTTDAPRVGTVARPETIHDFGGFDPALYRLRYPAVGHPALARRAVECLAEAGWPAQADEGRGLDHGAWVPLLHLYPQADVPVFQVSLPARLDADSAWAYGEALAPLRREGVLVIGSGSLTHNLHDFRGERAAGEADEPYVAAFAAWVREAALRGDRSALVSALEAAPHGRRAHPTPEHFWPLLVAAGAGGGAAASRVIDGEVVYGMLAMEGVGVRRGRLVPAIGH